MQTKIMTGLTYTEFKPDDDCYIVVFTPISPKQEVLEFLEGKVKEVSTVGADFPPSNHPLLRYFWQTPPKMIREIKAEVTDSQAAYRHPTDPIILNQEPGRHYLVVPPQECVRYLKEVLGQTQNTLGRTQQTLERKEKMNFVQQQKIGSLEAALRQYQRSRMNPIKAIFK